MFVLVFIFYKDIIIYGYFISANWKITKLLNYCWKVKKKEKKDFILVFII